MKKQHLSILYIVIISLLMGSTILLSKPSEKIKNDRIAGFINKRGGATVIAENNLDSVDAYTSKILKKEQLQILNKNSGINMQAYLIEDASGQVTLNLKYKQNGKSISKNNHRPFKQPGWS